LDGAALYVNSEAPPITGEALEALVIEYRAVASTIERLSRLYSSIVLWELVEQRTLTLADLETEQLVVDWSAELNSRLQDVAVKGSQYDVVVRRDAERSIYYPVVKLISHGVESESDYHHEFFGSSEYRGLRELGEKLGTLIEKEGYMQRGEKRLHTTVFSEGLNWLMKEAAKGYSIQRYKGLGEMNPDQLWETTMDPETRRMLKVTIEDAIAADQIFTTLMGDHVEPRREFIEENALSVANLDI